MGRAGIAILLVICGCAEAPKTVLEPNTAPYARAQLDAAGRDLDFALRGGWSQPSGEIGQPPDTHSYLRWPNCVAACQALRSFERAGARLCNLASPAECLETKRRVVRAGEQFVDACGPLEGPGSCP